MKNLQEIAGMDPKAKELLEAAGYFEASSLEGLSLIEITDEVVKVNHTLKLLKIDPTPSVVKQWLSPLIGILGNVEDYAAVVSDKDLVSSKELLAASFAIPLSRTFVERNEVDINDLLEARVRFVSDDITVKQVEYLDEPAVEPVAKEVVEEVVEEPVKYVDVVTNVEEVVGLEEGIDIALSKLGEDDEHSSGTVHIDKMDVRMNKDRILTMDAFRKGGSRIAPLQNLSTGDLIRSTRKETNEGIAPTSRRYVRGVLHKRAGSFMSSLLAYLTFILCIVSGFALPLLTLIDKDKFSWAIFALLLVIVGGMIYFMFTGRASCPICNQKQFAPKNCLKHRDAHHVPFLGYMLTTALHALFFRWFKCIFCGTSVRLKK